eukprot:g3321.t1
MNFIFLLLFLFCNRLHQSLAGTIDCGKRGVIKRCEDVTDGQCDNWAQPHYDNGMSDLYPCVAVPPLSTTAESEALEPSVSEGGDPTDDLAQGGSVKVIRRMRSRLQAVRRLRKEECTSTFKQSNGSTEKESGFLKLMDMTKRAHHSCKMETFWEGIDDSTPGECLYGYCLYGEPLMRLQDKPTLQSVEWKEVSADVDPMMQICVETWKYGSTSRVFHRYPKMEVTMPFDDSSISDHCEAQALAPMPPAQPRGTSGHTRGRPQASTDAPTESTVGVPMPPAEPRETRGHTRGYLPASNDALAEPVQPSETIGDNRGRLQPLNGVLNAPKTSPVGQPRKPPHHLPPLKTTL